ESRLAKPHRIVSSTDCLRATDTNAAPIHVCTTTQGYTQAHDSCLLTKDSVSYAVHVEKLQSD
ncbi:MAG TPA: hypothetical protein DCR06_04970, partial [Planctomycetaceae bacterium]|nr:hypothetical protein [Planctomycetaceae bacterium]